MTQVPWQVFVAMLLVIVAAITLLVRTTLKGAAGDELFLAYRDFENVRDLVTGSSGPPSSRCSPTSIRWPR